MKRKQLNLQAGQGDPAYIIYALPLALAVLAIVLAIVGGNTVRTLGLIGCSLANIFTALYLPFPLLALFRNRAWRSTVVEFLPFLIIWLLTTVILFIYSSIWLTAMILMVDVIINLVMFYRLSRSS